MIVSRRALIGGAARYRNAMAIDGLPSPMQAM